MALKIDRVPESDQHTLYDDDCDATPKNDIAGGPCTIYDGLIDNPNVTSVFLLLYDALAATLGTTEPDHIFECPASTKRPFSFGANPERFTVGLSICCVNNAYPAAAGSNPSSNVLVTLHGKEGAS